MNLPAPTRRAWLAAALLGAPAWAPAQADDDDAPRRGRELRFPRDHGAHPGARTEWWYATGWLQAAGEAALLGFQVTFFRSRTGLGAGLTGRFVPRQLIFAHAALTDLRAGRHRHAQRIARWSGDPSQGPARAALADTEVVLGAWALRRERRGDAGSRYRATLADDGAGFGLALTLDSTQPLLLQGEAGWSRKGPQPTEASHYYSQPQLAVAGTLQLDGRARAVTGRAWLDHEWSEQILDPAARGWDWIGINLDDGSALTAFRLRRADGSALWAGGSHRTAAGALTVFGPDELRFEPLAHWRSPATGARYPVRWRLHSPLGTHEIHALLDAQELDSRGNTGAIYWEGLSELTDGGGRRVGLGYLEMTGYAAPMTL